MILDVAKLTVAIEADSHDALFGEPFIEVDEERTEPAPHRYVHGGFTGTDARFSYYFPPRDQYQGRFFHNTYPMAISSDVGPFPIQFDVAVGDLGFTFDSGAYYVQTNNGGAFRAPGADPAIAAYRVNAAAAKFSRTVAARIYGEHRPYGYLFGGSGGAYQVLGAAENSSGIWDGFLPFVLGGNYAIPSYFTVRLHALRVLRDRLPAIVDAMEPGGSGDPYAGLDDEEAAALREVSLMGFPTRGWYDYKTFNNGYYAFVFGMVVALDPTYVDDFWTKPGYLGSDPRSPIRDLRTHFEATVSAVEAGQQVRIDLVDAPGRDISDWHVVVTSGPSVGASLPVLRNDGKSIFLIPNLDPAVIAAIQPGDTVRIDNSWQLAMQTYHRHQVPPSDDYYGWNQFRDAAGAPLYPQRDILIGPIGTTSSAGAMLSGRINAKVLMLSCLMDIDAYPWNADWYRSLVKQAVGADQFGDFALCFIDNAHHENPLTPAAKAHVIGYGPALQQGLHDLAGWVEHGVRPLETVYTVSDCQVDVPASATARGGIQPVVTLQADGSARAEIAVGQPVTFSAVVEAPLGAGQVVAAQWDFEGRGDYADAADIATPAQRIELTATHAYAAPGTYFAALRGTLHRAGDTQAAYCRVQNLARVRVVVR
jgi:hypothetical protein